MGSPPGTTGDSRAWPRLWGGERITRGRASREVDGKGGVYIGVRAIFDSCHLLRDDVWASEEPPAAAATFLRLLTNVDRTTSTYLRCIWPMIRVDLPPVPYLNHGKRFSLQLE